MYLLDADIVIYNLKGHPVVRKNLERHLHDVLRISVITLMELYYGAHKSQKVAGNLAKIKTLESELEIIPLGRETAEVFAILKANLERTGTPLDDFDVILASCALAHDLVLVSNNIRHFERIDGLKLVNWAEESV
jgi:tRNA(fMet)-specific endonuclease VapC